MYYGLISYSSIYFSVGNMKMTLKYYCDIFMFFQNKTVWHNQG